MNKQFRVVFVLCDFHLERPTLCTEMQTRKVGVALISLAALISGCYYLFNKKKNKKESKHIDQEAPSREEPDVLGQTSQAGSGAGLEVKDEITDKRMDTESLLEWIDRQLVEAEQRKKLREEM